MSEQTVELHRRIYDAFSARNLDALVALCDPSIAVESVFSAVSGTVYHGHDGVRRWQADLEDAWGDEIWVEAEAYYDVGEHTLAFDVLHGRGRESGAEVALPGAAVTRWRHGRCVYFKAYATEQKLSETLVSPRTCSSRSLRDKGTNEGFRFACPERSISGFRNSRNPTAPVSS